MIPEIFAILSSDGTVTALVGTNPVRIYPFGEAPEKTPLPYVTYTVISGQPQNELDKVPSVDVIGTQVDVWAETANSAWDVAAAARDAIEPHAHMAGFGSTTRDPETRRYRVRMDFDFFTER